MIWRANYPAIRLGVDLKYDVFPDKSLLSTTKRIWGEEGGSVIGDIVGVPCMTRPLKDPRAFPSIPQCLSIAGYNMVPGPIQAHFSFDRYPIQTLGSWHN